VALPELRERVLGGVFEEPLVRLGELLRRDAHVRLVLLLRGYLALVVLVALETDVLELGLLPGLPLAVHAERVIAAVAASDIGLGFFLRLCFSHFHHIIFMNSSNR